MASGNHTTEDSAFQESMETNQSGGATEDNPGVDKETPSSTIPRQVSNSSGSKGIMRSVVHKSRWPIAVL